MRLKRFFITLYATSSLLSFSLAHAASDFDFNFSIQGDRFHLEITQVLKQSLNELRQNFSPDLLTEMSNVVRSVTVTPLGNSGEKVSVRTSKHGLSTTIVGICSEKNSDSEWATDCSLDLGTGDTGDFFNSGTESVRCTTSTREESSCSFVMNASVKSQHRLIFYRSSEVLALGGIVERLHDQAVFNRMVNTNESPELAKENFEQTEAGNCLHQIYAAYRDDAQNSLYSITPLEVKASAWGCQQ